MQNLPQIIGSILLAIVPVLVWGTLFYIKRPINKSFSVVTFIAGALAVFPILLYKTSWTYLPWVNAFNFAEKYKQDYIGLDRVGTVSLSVLITFMLVGVIEELMKYFAVEMTDDDKLLSIDDSIAFFIIAALGFSFTENILYFYNIWVRDGGQNIFTPFIFRATFSTFAHVMFSGILGYYHGVAEFAKPILQEEMRAKRRRPTLWFHKIVNRKKVKEFHQEKMFEGLLIAIGLHAIFNILLEMT
ncbi:MAG TPA: PrsW family glutamic-type intramembrane protease, partial [Candidatus Gracilibacteria bacterium]|nr:PrsW family glutamic-type intramembrane protease [Candidatus Gracilibacteria bacterium]